MVERVTAKKCGISDLVGGRYVLKDGTQPSYVETPHGEVSRANLIAAIVAKPGKRSVVVDDGTGQVEARSFDDETLFERVAVGDVVLLIGRPRRFQEQTYLVAEICKRLSSPKWLELRRAELTKGGDGRAIVTQHEGDVLNERKKDTVPAAASSAEATGRISPKNSLLKEKSSLKEKMNEERGKTRAGSEQEAAAALVTTTDGILAIIRELDAGQGAPVEKVVAKAGRADAETVLTNLLAEGEIFEIRPGRVKVLE